MICEKCGCEIDGKSPICMNCGARIPDEHIDKETMERLKAEVHDTHKASDASSIKAVGAFIMIVGIIIDVISMFTISSFDFGLFNTLTIAGTISFLVGLFLLSNG